MSDTTLNQFISRGTNAQRVAFTPNPATPATGNNPSYIFYETDTGNTYMWDGSAWQKVNTGSSGLTLGQAAVGMVLDVPDYESPHIVPIPGQFSPTLPGLVPQSGGGTSNFLRADGAWVAPPSSGGGTSASIRSSNIQSSSASSFTVSFPTGASVGDLVIIICGSGFGMSLPSGWTWLEHASQSNFLGDVFSRVLTSTDITNGSITITQGGSFNAVICAICFTGAPTIKNMSSTKDATGAATRSVSISTGFTATDFAVYWGMNRDASANSLNLGSAVQSINAASASGVVTAGTTGATSLTLTATYGTFSGTTGDYQGIMVLSG